MALDAGQLREAARRIAAWRADPKVPVACPVCGKLGLAIVDRSARPHAEWYALTCSACGLERDAQHPARIRSAIAGLIAMNIGGKLLPSHCGYRPLPPCGGGYREGGIAERIGRRDSPHP